jgi:hypothetical protein
MKNIIKIIIGIIILIVAMLYCFDIYLQRFPREKKAKKVSNNIEKVQIGMSNEKILSILGSPDTSYFDSINYKAIDSVKINGYYLGFGSADYLWLTFSKEDVVINKYSAY